MDKIQWDQICLDQGVGYFWEAGEIRLLNAFWVVILLKILYLRSVGFFHPELCWYCLGNLSLFFFLVACLQGALTIQATSTYNERELGILVLWEGTNLGGIRMETAAVIRTLFSALVIFWIFLALGSSSQPWLSWSIVFLHCDGRNLLGFILGISLEGAITILAASAYADRVIGIFVLWDSTRLGVIRKGAASGLGHFSPPFLFFFCSFIVHYSGSQTWFVWCLRFFSKPFLAFTLSQLFLVMRMEGCWMQEWFWDEWIFIRLVWVSSGLGWMKGIQCFFIRMLLVRSEYKVGKVVSGFYLCNQGAGPCCQGLDGW
ncbi:hypothetical protein Hdeb2414_s1062g00977271 [Helianthus debilis subsp. tardiflorus]